MHDLQAFRLLILGDDKETANMWTLGLRQSGLQVAVLALNRTTITSLQPTANTFSLALLDINKAETDEVEFCRLMSTEFTNPLLVFTYETDERVLLRIYEAGADECIVKPIGTALLMSKVQAWLRRAQVAAAQTQRSSNSEFNVEFDERRVTTPQGTTVRLSRLEFRLFYLLLTNHDQILETDLLIDRVWDLDGGDNNQLKNLVYRLRQKLEPNPSEPRYIHTEPNYGYVLRTR